MSLSLEENISEIKKLNIQLISKNDLIKELKKYQKEN